ncbi:MAG: MmcQ/YjbR family DNA-binding protein [Frankiaceae bacterium]|nr:MmcQ/YjbR family DNA-binding protein [Arenimonas sp.]
MALPGTTEAPHHKYSSFRVGGKIYATVPPDGLHLHVFVDEIEREHALAQSPEAFTKLTWGDAAAGLRVVLAKAKPAAVHRLLHSAWARKAPRKAVAAHPNPMPS